MLVRPRRSRFLSYVAANSTCPGGAFTLRPNAAFTRGPDDGEQSGRTTPTSPPCPAPTHNIIYYIFKELYQSPQHSQHRISFSICIEEHTWELKLRHNGGNGSSSDTRSIYLTHTTTMYQYPSHVHHCGQRHGSASRSCCSRGSSSSKTEW